MVEHSVWIDEPDQIDEVVKHLKCPKGHWLMIYSSPGMYLKYESIEEPMPYNDFKDLKCAQCDKLFGRAAHLKSHQLTHSDEKLHSCAECNKSFGHAHHLVKHAKTHTGEKS